MAEIFSLQKNIISILNFLSHSKPMYETHSYNHRYTAYETGLETDDIT